MGWIKLDDGFFLNPKVMAAGPQAALLHLSALCWAGTANTDGFVPLTALRTISALVLIEKRKPYVQRLLDVGLWHETEGGYVIHDFLQWQRSSDERSHQRERNRAKAERHRERATANRGSNPASNRVTNPAGDRSVTEPEGRGQKEKESSRGGTADSPALEAEFETWYRAYPRKRERPAALAKYKARRRAGVPAEALLLAAERYAAYGRRTARPPEMTKHPATFLNNGWEDWVPGGAADQEAQATTHPINAYEVPK